MKTAASALCCALGLLFGSAGAAGAEFGIDALRQLIEDRPIATVEQLLEALPADLRSHYVLMFASRSLQEASFPNPRAILFGSTAKFIVTFNGDPTQRGFAALETLEFDPAANRFNFREITFGHDGTPPVISAENPARCVACHDSPARPVWDVPPAWPGAYGERYGAGLSAAERRGMQSFLSAQPAHPRYRFLLGTGTRADRDTYVPNARALYGGGAVEPPNARLSALLAAQNVRFILSQLGARPGFAEHLPAMLAAAGSTCGSVADFFPPDLEVQTRSTLQRFTQTTAAADARQAHAKALRRAAGDAGWVATPAADEFNDLRYVAEYGLGASTRHWTLAFERGSYDLRAPPATPTFEQTLFEWLARTDDELRSVAEYRTYNPGDAYCEHLRRSSRAALAGWYARHPGAMATSPAGAATDSSAPAAAERDARILSHCQGCHDSGAAPALPFAQPRVLAARLTEAGYPHGRLLDEILFRLAPEAGPARMPRASNIDAATQRELENYFIELAQSR